MIGIPKLPCHLMGASSCFLAMVYRKTVLQYITSSAWPSWSLSTFFFYIEYDEKALKTFLYRQGTLSNTYLGCQGGHILEADKSRLTEAKQAG